MSPKLRFRPKLRIRVSLRNLLIVGGALTLLVASLAAGSWVGYGWWQDRSVASARDDSTIVAKRTVEGMFGYNYHSIDDQMKKVTGDMTPDFKADWMKVTNSVLAPGAKDKQLVVEATVVETGVISASADHTEIMIFLNQKSTGKDASKGTYDASRLRVKMDHKGGHWLVADVNPI
ncbi:hypothetical protein [Nocardia sp. NBC_01388]|uniref:hypothetical protein n=1 Tax=Nocardia sp. NBC_01388 TaxID=2903596 RepID=UPI00324C7C47